MTFKPSTHFYEYQDSLKRLASYKAAVCESAGIYLRRVPWIQKLRYGLSIFWYGDAKTEHWRYITHNPISIVQAFKLWVRCLRLIFA